MQKLIIHKDYFPLLAMSQIEMVPQVRNFFWDTQSTTSCNRKQYL